MKKQDKSQHPTITVALLETLMSRPEANRKFDPTVVCTAPPKLQPPDLYQDAGGGYNSNLTYPQK